MKRFLFFILATTLIYSCGQSDQSRSVSNTSNEKENSPDYTVALTFINEYAKFCSPTNSSSSDTNWIDNNPLLTDNFKGQYNSIIESGRQSDPELGLGFDPIFDAQDFPDEGFEIASSDSRTGLVTVKGKDWPEFILVLKVVKQDNKSLVEGSGIINIPKNKRAKR